MKLGGCGPGFLSCHYGQLLCQRSWGFPVKLLSTKGSERGDYQAVTLVSLPGKMARRQTACRSRKMSPIITAVVQLVEQNILQNFVLNKEFLIQDFVLTRTLSQAESRFAFVPPVPLSFLARFSLLLLVGLHPGHPPAESTSRRVVAGRIGLWLGRVPYKSRPETSLSPPGPLLWAVSRQPLW